MAASRATPAPNDCPLPGDCPFREDMGRYGEAIETLKNTVEEHGKQIQRHGEALARIFGASAMGSLLGGAIVALAMKALGH